MEDKDLRATLIYYFIKRYFKNQTPPPADFLLDIDDLYFTDEEAFIPLGQSLTYDRASRPEIKQTPAAEPRGCKFAHSQKRAD
ncbi:MAG: hypothetical protein JXR70_13820 [Spirochaetales bacterium]|nr:hypothetical protein [Spirochaetales bacterium]